MSTPTKTTQADKPALIMLGMPNGTKTTHAPRFRSTYAESTRQVTRRRGPVKSDQALAGPSRTRPGIAPARQATSGQ